MALLPCRVMAEYTYRVVTNDTGKVISYRQISRPDDYMLAAPSNGLWSAYSPPMGTYRYRIKWRDSEVGSVRMTLVAQGTNVVATLYGRSEGALDKVSKFSYRGEAILYTNDYRTIGSLLVERQRSRRRVSAVHFFEDGRVTSFRRKTSKNSIRESNRELTAGRWTHDPLSFAMTLRGLRWEKGLTAELEVFDGDKLYVVYLECTGKTVRSTPSGRREAWTLVPGYSHVNEEEDEEKQEHDTVLYIATDETRDFLGAKSVTPVGKVEIKLQSYEPPVSVEKIE